MSEEQQALARRAVACKHWRWMPGMHSNHKARYLGDDCWIDKNAKGLVYSWPNQGEVPDLTDPATLGCLLALVREAWGDPSLCAKDAGTYDLMFWHVYTNDQFVAVGCDTESAALVAALEAAPWK